MRLLLFLSLCTLLLLAGHSFTMAQSPVDKRAEKQAREQVKREQKEAQQRELDKYKYFVITSDPPGATITLNGDYLGKTPYKVDVKQNFFYNGPRFLISTYISVPWTMTISKEGYVTQSVPATRGPFLWESADRSRHLVYYVVAYPEFVFKLEPVGQFIGSNPLLKSPANENPKTSGLSTEQIVQKAMPAVVTVKTPTKTGSGFFILSSGVIVTNRHVVGMDKNVSILTSKGEFLQSKSVFIHPVKDLALIKVDGGPFPFIPLADPAAVNVGADVVAIGSPGIEDVSLQNTVTRGIVSSFRDSQDRGLFIQTDAALNHGNSGGPLLNNKAEVIGVNTLGLVELDKEGLNFALFCSEVLLMLKEHFNFTPEYQKDPPETAKNKPGENSNKVSVQIVSEPQGAEIYIDGKFVGSTPSRISVTAGDHTIKIVRPGYKDWIRQISVEPGSEPTFNAILEKIQP